MSEKGHSNWKKQPNSNHCFVCGLENPSGLKLSFYDNGLDEVSCTYTISEEFQGYPGIAHGGVIAAILDEAAGRTVLISDTANFMMTAHLDIKYRAPVPVGQPLHIVGPLIKNKGRIAQTEAEIYLPDGTLAVQASATIVAPSNALKADQEQLAALGWRVVEDA